MNSCSFQPWEAEWETKVWNAAQRWFSGQHQIFSTEFCNLIHYNIETKLLQSICLHYGVKISWRLFMALSPRQHSAAVTSCYHDESQLVGGEWKVCFQVSGCGRKHFSCKCRKSKERSTVWGNGTQSEAILIKDFFFHLLHLTVCNIKLL